MSASSEDQELCPICEGELDEGGEISQIRQKGADGINKASSQRGDAIVVTVGTKVHIKCRREYTKQQNILVHLSKKGASPNSPKKTRKRSAGPFISKTDCLFCGIGISPGNSDYSYVKTDSFTRTILECCDDRKDNWSFTVKGRIEYFGSDLHAADCVYHHLCSTNFRSGRDVPHQFRSDNEAKCRKSGRPKDQEKEEAFSKMCSYLEDNDEEQLTISDLRDKMQEFLINEDTVSYGNQYLKERLKDRYKSAIHIAEGEGLHDIVTMREKTSHILRSYFKSTQKGDDEETQKMAIIKTAARLIKSDIKTNVPSTKDQYPSTNMLSLDSTLIYLPETLRIMLDSLFVGNDNRRKVASIGQAIVQTVRPRAVIAPLQISLGVQTHHLYRSKFLVDSLFSMGFCSSYKEVMRFEKNAAAYVAPDVLGEDIRPEATTALFAADNVDHNIITLDGKGTFHGMGMIAALTPGRNTNLIIPRRDGAELNIVDTTKIEIMQLRFAKHARRSMKFQALPNGLDYDKRVDILWELSFNFKQATPNWPGMMHTIHRGNEHPGQSSVVYLPMIDMYSGDKTCILSTLEYLCKLALKYNLSPIITFDQPLYWKAAEIINDAPENSILKRIVLLLGCFHTFMNLLGAIGTLMQGTGLKDILETVYGENAVLHMLTGKSVQRAFRGHLLVDKCLNRMIITDVVQSSPQFATLVDQSEEIYSSLVAGEKTLEGVETSDIIDKIKEELDKRKSELQATSKTSQLWLNYQKMLKVARALIMADRTGSWQMHLGAVADCLPIFAAAGHYNYLKSAYLYVQEMNELDTRHPDVFRKFSDGFHVVRRSNQFWAGLSSDLVIEQTLMRSLKSTGGLTRGSGMSEEQRSLWTMSVPITSEYNNAMQEFNHVSYTTSEQHKESTGSRISRDLFDLSKIRSKLDVNTPFSPDPSLRNVVNGVVATEDVNVHLYESVGMKIIEKMIEQPVFKISFKRKDKAKTLGDMSSVQIAPEQTIDPALLFQRFVVVSQTGELLMQEVMNYELSPFPPSLFEARNLFREADKPQIAVAIAEHSRKVSDEAIKATVPKTDHYVLDGGSLLHRLQWKTRDSYGTIAQSYADFTVRHYGLATVVFDGYGGGPSIKDNTHKRRGQNTHPIVHFTEETEFSGRPKKDDFLSRDKNKEGLIALISSEMRKKGCNVINAPGDADVEIVKAAVQSSRTQSTTLIGEDTDLLILLLYYANVQEQNVKELYYRSDKTDTIKVYDINRLRVILGKDICSQLLFCHAFTGCDSTSRIFGIGKKTCFQKLVTKDPILTSCKYFHPPKADQGSHSGPWYQRYGCFVWRQ